MPFFKKYRFEIIVSIFIIALFFFTRFYNLLSLPIFTDEAIYIRWAQIAKNDANWRFISLTDGKQPMFIWLTMIAMRFIDDPLLAGRIVSVIAGFFTLIGLFFLCREIFKKTWIGILCSFFYLVYPMAVVYDRMALYDSLVGTFAVWSLYFTILLVRRIRLDFALILGMIIGGGVLTKTIGFFSIYLLPLSLILSDWQKKERLKRFLKWLGLALIVVIAAYGYYSILRLSPFFHIIDEKNTIFVYSLNEWVMHPFNFFVGNWKAFWDWLTRYTTWPVLLLILASFFLDPHYIKEKLLLFLWFLIPIISLAIFGRTLYPRFIFFMTLSLLPLAAFSLSRIYQIINRKFLFTLLCLFILVLSFRSDYFILNDFAHAPIPESDLGQYYNDWPSGGGVKEAVAFFKDQAQKGKIYIATQGTFGLLPYALEIYLINNPNIRIEGFWPIENTIPKKVIEESKKVPTYFVFYQPCQTCRFTGIAPTTWNLNEIVYQYKKTNQVSFFSIYQVQ